MLGASKTLVDDQLKQSRSVARTDDCVPTKRRVPSRNFE